MSSALKGQMFGMPRWVWLLLLAGGIGVGLYWRSRSAAAAAEGEGEMPAEGDEAYGYTEDYFDPSQDPSLAGLGVYPETGGGYYPWQTDSGQQITWDLLSTLLSGKGDAERAQNRKLKALQRRLAALRKKNKKDHDKGGGKPNRKPDRFPQGDGSRRRTGPTPTGGGAPRRRTPPHAHMPVRVRGSHSPIP